MKMKNTMCFMRGMGVGLAAGVATAAAVKCICMKSKKFRKKTTKAARAVSDIMSDIEQLLS